MDDLINRQAALDAVSDLYWMDERLLNFKKEIDATFDKIKALPSAQPERKHKQTRELKLKPCPFCGGKAELIGIAVSSGLSGTNWLVKCVNHCCEQMPYPSDHDAIEAWNRRAEQNNG